mgnify:CR=1 FL=1
MKLKKLNDKLMTSLAASAMAQGGEITRTVDVFSEIKVYDGISVKLIPSEASAEILFLTESFAII